MACLARAFVAGIAVDGPRLMFDPAEVSLLEPLGAETLIVVELEANAGEVTARLHRDTRVQMGDAVVLSAPPRAFYLFDGESGQRLN